MNILNNLPRLSCLVVIWFCKTEWWSQNNNHYLYQMAGVRVLVINLLDIAMQCTEVRFASFLSGGINESTRKNWKNAPLCGGLHDFGGGCAAKWTVRNTNSSSFYRVSHSKPGKIIMPWWWYILWFLTVSVQSIAKTICSMYSVRTQHVESTKIVLHILD